MTPRWLRLPAAGFPLLMAVSAIAAGADAPLAAPIAAAPPERETYIDGVRDTGQFLPDTTVLLRVGDRVSRVRDFVGAYFSSFAEHRPPSDSLGRVEFLNSLINKEVLALTALAANRPLSFEDRAVLRENRERVLANTAFQRMVLDSIRITEDDLRRVHEQFAYQQRLRRIRFADRVTAERVRASLVGKRLPWNDAVRLHHRALKDETPNGELGWAARDAFAPATARALFALPPGGISAVLPDGIGFVIYQAVERRPVSPPAYASARRIILQDLRAELADGYAGRVRAEVARGLEIRHDSTNIAWAAAQFSGKPLVEPGEGGEVIVNLDREAPEFTPPDAGRVLARHRDGEFTLGQFVHAYSEVGVAMRPIVNNVDSFREYLDLMILQPYLARLAEERGLDRDSLAVAQMSRREEQLRVEHLYDDSVASRVAIEPAERRSFYQDNLHQLVTYPKVRFAAIIRFSQAAAESLVARIKAGEKPEDILRADSLAGMNTGSIQERQENDHGPYHKILFEELRPGDARVEGPDRNGRWLVLKSLAFDPGRQLSYDESQQYVDDALRNAKSEALLMALIARHRPHHRIESHPEWVMKVRFVDPTLAE